MMQHDVACVRGSPHHVQFYESDLVLAESVASFLAAVVMADGCAVVVATPDHSAAFMSSLRARGIDPDALHAESRLIVRDADEVLSRFMVDGMPDAARFTAAITSVFDALAPGAGEVRIYGEMVALLWDRGDVNAAIALEDHWNDLGRERAFELLCAYPMRAFDDPALGAAFARVCEQHEHVIPVEDLTADEDRDEWRRREIARLQRELRVLQPGHRRRWGVAPADSLGPLAYQAFYINSPDGVLFANPNGDVLAANPAACEILRLSEAEICTLGGFGLADRSDPRWEQLLSVRQRTGLAAGIARMRRGDGSPIEVEMSDRVFSDTNGTPRACTIIRDVTERVRRQAELVRLNERLRELTVTDELTGLHNRRGFLTVGGYLLELGQRRQAQLSVLFLDVDNLKLLNDRLGHPAGDAALKAVGDALRTTLPRADTVARIGGDEFVALALDLGGSDCAAIARRIEEQLSLPATVSAVGRPVEVSIGWTTLQPGDVNQIKELIELADRAMYTTKGSKSQRGRSPVGAARWRCAT